MIVWWKDFVESLEFIVAVMDGRTHSEINVVTHVLWNVYIYCVHDKYIYRSIHLSLSIFLDRLRDIDNENVQPKVNKCLNAFISAHISWICLLCIDWLYRVKMREEYVFVRFCTSNNNGHIIRLLFLHTKRIRYSFILLLLLIFEVVFAYKFCVLVRDHVYAVQLYCVIDDSFFLLMSPCC